MNGWTCPKCGRGAAVMRSCPHDSACPYLPEDLVVVERSQLAEREAAAKDHAKYLTAWIKRLQEEVVFAEREKRELVDELRDEQIARWHERGDDDDPPLHEWLGMTWDEYAAWVQPRAALAKEDGEGE